MRYAFFVLLGASRTARAGLAQFVVRLRNVRARFPAREDSGPAGPVLGRPSRTRAWVHVKPTNDRPPDDIPLVESVNARRAFGNAEKGDS